MADPLSITGLALQVGALVKQLYDYGTQVKDAQNDIIRLSSELSALNSIFNLLSQYEQLEVVSQEKEFQKMLNLTASTMEDMSRLLAKKSTPFQKSLQSLKWPFNAVTLREQLSKLERLKTWFLLAFTLDSKQNSDDLRSQMRQLMSLFEGDVAARQQKGRKDASKLILDRIAPVSPSAIHHRACSTWEGTASGSWFCEKHLRDWLDNRSEKDRILVLTARSGAGKTTLMSRAIEYAKQYFRDHKNANIAYFYCAYNDGMSQEARNVVGSWLAQISAETPSFLAEVQSKLQDVDEITTDHLEEGILAAGVKRPTVLFLDAVNESFEARALADIITKLVNSTADIRCVLSATPHLRAIKVGISAPARIFEIQPEHTIPDIEQYIKDRVSTHAILSAIGEGPILARLVPKCEGVFRWVDCQLSYLASQLTPKLVRRALENLPGSLDDTYEAILTRVAPADREIVRETLLWLSFCHRPLRLLSLCEAVVIEEGDVTIDGNCRIQDPEQLLSLCHGLAIYDASSERVSLAHSSVKAFLTGEHIQHSSVAYFALDRDTSVRHVLRKCLNYLLMDDFKIGFRTDTLTHFEDSLDRSPASFPLLGYASTRWAIHAGSCVLLEPEMDLIVRFFKTKWLPNGGNFNTWICCIVTPRSFVVARKSEPLYYAASYGLTQVVRTLITTKLVGRRGTGSPWHIDQKGGRFQSSPLEAATFRGHTDMVKLLLESGADPNAPSRGAGSPLKCAMINHYDEIVQKLVEYGAEDPGLDQYQQGIGEYFCKGSAEHSYS